MPRTSRGGQSLLSRWLTRLHLSSPGAAVVPPLSWILVRTNLCLPSRVLLLINYASFCSATSAYVETQGSTTSYSGACSLAPAHIFCRDAMPMLVLTRPRAYRTAWWAACCSACAVVPVLVCAAAVPVRAGHLQRDGSAPKADEPK
jgi:hypothetical protein